MDLAHVAVQLLLAIACGIVGNMLIPRQIPGKFLGLIIVGFVGVWLGEWSYKLFRNQSGIEHPILQWHIQEVPIIPAIIGCAIVIYILTTFLRWGRYSR